MNYLLKNPSLLKVRLRQAHRTYLMLDYDGTLTPIVPDPRHALLGRETRKVLQSLSELQPNSNLTIVSGRSLSDVQQLTGIENCYYIGNHGLEIAGPNLNFVNVEASKCLGSMEKIHEHLRDLERLGAVVEDKRLTLTVHYRRVSPRVVPLIKNTVQKAVRPHPVKITYGKKVLEIRPRTRWNKGLAATWLIGHLGGGLPVYIGDDQTDEDAFKSLRNGITVLVARRWRRSYAHYRLNDCQEVLGFLRIMNLWLRDK